MAQTITARRAGLSKRANSARSPLPQSVVAHRAGEAADGLAQVAAATLNSDDDHVRLRVPTPCRRNGPAAAI